MFAAFFLAGGRKGREENCRLISSNSAIKGLLENIDATIQCSSISSNQCKYSYVYYGLNIRYKNPVSKHQIQPEYEDEQADAGRDG